MTDTSAPVCPECGGALVLDDKAERGTLIAPPFFVVGVSRLEERRVPTAVAFCSACEFCLEVR
jgi:hypothetical protein